jgi:hypothetical protein
VASAAGVALERVLWVRCKNADQALRATDLLIQAGGFGLVAVDLSDIAPRIVRYVPLNAWFRFRRAVEDTPTILMVMEQEANAKTCASLVLRLEARPGEWSEAGGISDPSFLRNSMGRLFRGFEIATDVVRTRVQDVNEVMAINEFKPWRTTDVDSGSKQDRTAMIQAATNWSGFRG